MTVMDNTTTTSGVTMTSTTTQGIKTVLHPVSDLAAAKPVYAREHCREQILKAIRVLEARLNAVVPPEQGNPSDLG